MGVLYGRALVQPTTIDQEAREVDVVCATEKMVTRFSWDEDYDEMLVCEASAVRMDRANQGLPLLDCHNSYSVHSQVGRTVKVWINESRQLCARVRFSSRPEVAGLFQDVVDGIVKGISVGYEIYKFEREERPNGARPIYRATSTRRHRQRHPHRTTAASGRNHKQTNHKYHHQHEKNESNRNR